MNTAWTFRPATEDDVAAIVDLVESAYRGEASRAGWTTEADLLDGQRVDAAMVQAAIAGPGAIILAVDAGEIVGCAEIKDEGAGTGYFGMFAVAPTRQGSGLGRVLMERCLAECRDRWDARRIRMTVIAQRGDLIAWYERLGFQRTGASEPFPYGDERFGVPKRDDLEFVELVRELEVIG